MNDITIIPLATPDRYMVFHKGFRQIPSETMQRVITQKIGFKWASVVNLITGGTESVYLVERQYE